MRDPFVRLHDHLTFLYGAERAAALLPILRARIAAFRQAHPFPPPPPERLTQEDAFLITYADQFQEAGRPPLQTLAAFLSERLHGLVNGVHLLPFFPYSSDDGFAVIDYTQVNPAFGDWEDLRPLRARFRLMFDAVINHVSTQSAWFQGFLRDEAPWRDFFITVAPDTDLSQVVRPRTSPLLTPFETAAGRKWVWTTFSADQVDLNYANPEVLLAVGDVLLFYAAQRAEIIRLDAIAYLWKQIGTSCIHLPQTHRVVKYFRALLDAAAPHVLLITETNVPHEENISYFGDLLPDGSGTDEAQLVYQFPLAPLILHTFLTGDAAALTGWAEGLRSPPGGTFFNFIASHDGIGVRPAEGLLSPKEIAALVESTLSHGGRVSYKTNADGSRSPYELNITLYDALNDPARPSPLDAPRFLASQAIMLALAGVPGIYVHSLFGSRNCLQCVERQGYARAINREKFRLERLLEALGRAEAHTAQVFNGYAQLLRVRREHPAFHPFGRQEVLRLHPGVFALQRTAPDGSERLLCLHNVTSRGVEVTLPTTAPRRDLLTGESLPGPRLRLEPYQVRWMTE